MTQSYHEILHKKITALFYQKINIGIADIQTLFFATSLRVQDLTCKDDEAQRVELRRADEQARKEPPATMVCMLMQNG